MLVISMGKLGLNIIRQVRDWPLIVTESNDGGERKDGGTSISKLRV